MEVILDRCCGIDVHKLVLTACVIISKGRRVLKKEIRAFTTMTEDIERLREWLKGEGITHVVMESTGIYWRPVYNILEEDFEVVLANAKHIKNVPGRKTDVKDSEWLCMLLRNGLIRGSFIPPKHIRQLKDLTRHRTKGTYLGDKHQKLKVRRGANKATIAIGQKILISVYSILKEGVPYKELGAHYLDSRNKRKSLRYYMNKIQQLGYEILLTEKDAA